MIIIRYTDDSVHEFQYRNEAEMFLSDLKERMFQFGLELHGEKTKLIQFGRLATTDCKNQGLKKPKTFNFLGFTHYCGFIRATGEFMVWRKTIRKRI